MSKYVIVAWNQNHRTRVFWLSEVVNNDVSRRSKKYIWLRYRVVNFWCDQWDFENKYNLWIGLVCFYNILSDTWKIDCNSCWRELARSLGVKLFKKKTHMLYWVSISIINIPGQRLTINLLTVDVYTNRLQKHMVQLEWDLLVSTLNANSLIYIIVVTNPNQCCFKLLNCTKNGTF